MKKVTELYGLHAGEDIYIIGTGPSLRVFPLSLFEGRVTIGLNNAHEKVPVRYSVTVHPDLYVPEFIGSQSALGPMDWIVPYEKTKNLVSPEQFRRAEERFYFFDSNGRKNSQPPHEPSDAGRVLEWVKKPSGNFLYLWSSIAQTAANLAANMGAKNIFLVGCDSAALLDNTHCFAKPTRWKGASPAVRYRQYYEGLAEVRAALRERGVNLVSVTPFMGLGRTEEDFKRLCGELGENLLIPSPGDRSPKTALSEWVRWVGRFFWRG
ncbi:MAG: hypothetical protein HYZ87_01025 [Candidatus Omnitrophica bacterium]|nr:hypothetical protein [Candidatus Omnitrophota bacterium]